MYSFVNIVQSSSSTPSTAADKYSFHIRGVADDPPADGPIEVDTISTQQPTPALISYPSAQAHSNEYELTILSTHAGVEESTLMFITDEEVNLSTQVRKPIALDLHLINPIETECIVFAVKMRGMAIIQSTCLLDCFISHFNATQIRRTSSCSSGFSTFTG
ncbi:hypothetical protein BLNAU_8212 [Blattamonas nauphoetae]|uniref:Uncharacterized protein n=1 Tax=Blattamonas nauphoetae TaxID=2049346 RepID=A0ABQ9XZ60_9EUKA|nr:hypothetical protein BLNAU_8212 [Blattamonas nauphoetae]